VSLYLDTSGLAKLLVEEPETEAVRALVAGHTRVVSSALAEVELMRVAHRIGDDLVPHARYILDALNIAAITPPILRSAGNLLPGTGLRSVDAIHLATAIALPDLVTVCTYDPRMLAAAASLGMPTANPG